MPSNKLRMLAGYLSLLRSVANSKSSPKHTTSSYLRLFLPPRCLQYGTEFFFVAKLGMMWRVEKQFLPRRLQYGTGLC